MAFESVNPGDASKLIACDDVGGERVQVVKPAFGPDGVATMVDETNRLPVSSVVSGTVAVAGAVTVSSQPASSRTTDTVSAALATDAIMIGGTVATPKFAFANVAASSTDSSIVAAVAGKRIRVLSYRLNVAATATNATFNTKPGGAGTAVSETYQLDARATWSSGFSHVGHIQTGVSEGLAVTTSTGSQVGVGVVYIEV